MIRQYVCLLMAFLVISSICSTSQVTPGILPYSSWDAHQYDSINLSDLSVMLDIPLRNKSAGPLPFSSSLKMQNYIYSPVSNFLSAGVRLIGSDSNGLNGPTIFP